MHFSGVYVRPLLPRKSGNRVILKCTVDLPFTSGVEIPAAFATLGREFVRRAGKKCSDLFPPEEADAVVTGYLFARTITCPYCDGLVPLSGYWKLSARGDGINIIPRLGPKRVCEFEVVDKATNYSEATASDGDHGNDHVISISRGCVPDGHGMRVSTFGGLSASAPQITGPRSC
jgi:hypothetical protein